MEIRLAGLPIRECFNCINTFLKLTAFSNFQLFCHAENEILCPPHGSNHAVGQRLFQLILSCSCLLRTCEVFLQSGGTADRDGTTDPDQFPDPRIKNLFILKIEDFFPDLHRTSLQVRFAENLLHYHGKWNRYSSAMPRLHATLLTMKALMRNDNYWMEKALALAKRAAALGEVPIGAVLVKDGKIIGRGFNRREGQNDPSAHAEMLAIRQAARRLAAWRLTGTTLYVTLEPCPMCMGAIILARIERLVFGSFDPKAGAAGSLYNLADDPRFNHRIELESGVRGNECSELLSGFFRELRRQKQESRTIVRSN